MISCRVRCEDGPCLDFGSCRRAGFCVQRNSRWHGTAPLENPGGLPLFMLMAAAVETGLPRAVE